MRFGDVSVNSADTTVKQQVVSGANVTTTQTEEAVFPAANEAKKK